MLMAALVNFRLSRDMLQLRIALLLGGGRSEESHLGRVKQFLNFLRQPPISETGLQQL